MQNDKFNAQCGNRTHKLRILNTELCREKHINSNLNRNTISMRWKSWTLGMFTSLKVEHGSHHHCPKPCWMQKFTFTSILFTNKCLVLNINVRDRWVAYDTFAIGFEKIVYFANKNIDNILFPDKFNFKIFKN